MIYRKKHYQKNKETLRDKQRSRCNKKASEISLKHQKTKKGKATSKRARMKARLSGKQAVRSKVSKAIKSGRLLKRNCQVCDKKTVHAHHENYDKPLDVLWLCPQHHADLHRLGIEKLKIKY